MATEPPAAVDLYWLPLGAGGHFVRMNGRIYEALAAWRGKRSRRDLYHSALIVTMPAGTFVIEQAWPIPSGDKKQRGVVAEGPVGTERARSLRFLRYEVRPLARRRHRRPRRSGRKPAAIDRRRHPRRAGPRARPRGPDPGLGPRRSPCR